MNISIWTCILVFASIFITDAIWAIYIIRTVGLRPVVASNLSALLFGGGAYAIIEYTENKIYLIPAIIGAWLGTYAAVKYETYRLKRSK